MQGWYSKWQQPQGLLKWQRQPYGSQSVWPRDAHHFDSSVMPLPCPWQALLIDSGCVSVL